MRVKKLEMCTLFGFAWFLISIQTSKDALFIIKHLTNLFIRNKSLCKCVRFTLVKVYHRT